MILRHFQIATLFALAPAMAQDKSLVRDEVQKDLDSLSAGASAAFRSADSVEASLNAAGLTLHPRIHALRTRLESSMREARAALDKGDPEAAGDALRRAEALFERISRQLGGI